MLPERAKAPCLPGRSLVENFGPQENTRLSERSHLAAASPCCRSDSSRWSPQYVGLVDAASLAKLANILPSAIWLGFRF